MDFALTSDQQKIRETAESFLAQASDSRAVRAAMRTECGYEPRVWSRIGQESDGAPLTSRKHTAGWVSVGWRSRC